MNTWKVFGVGFGTHIKSWSFIPLNWLSGIPKKALYYSDIGIETCVSSSSLHGLALLYTRKGIAESHLGYENYKRSLAKAINLHDMTGQDKLKDMLIKSCKKNYNIDI